MMLNGYHELKVFCQILHRTFVLKMGQKMGQTSIYIGMSQIMSLSKLRLRWGKGVGEIPTHPSPRHLNLEIGVSEERGTNVQVMSL